MISRVTIKNFKSIGEPGVDLELKPLTLLVGPNGGGKSSILEAIAVAIQRNPTGTLTQFRTWEAIIHKTNDIEATTELYFDAGEQNANLGLRWTYGTHGQKNIEYLVNEEVSRSRAVKASIDRQASESQRNTFLLGSVRGDVPYLANTSTEPDRIGIHGEHLLLLLAIIFGQRRYQDAARGIARWAERFGISELNAGIRGSGQSGSDYWDNELKVVLDVVLSSSGAKQILTVITQLFWSPKGSLLMIEEPEISLHPKAQVDVLQMFSEAIRKDDKQIIATTHSLILLQALGYVVQKGWLSREDMAVYHIEKRRTGTSAKQLPLGKEGYIRGWVPSYTKVERELLREWAKTLPRG